jgi:hypothetical protein
MRVLAPLVAAGSILLALLGCSENSLSSIPDDPEIVDTADPGVPPDIPPPPAPEVRPPIAYAGPDRTVATGTDVVLDGSASYDPQGLEPLDFAWTLVSFPPGSSVSIDGLDRVDPVFTADVAGPFVFELTVANSEAMWDETPAVVTITAEEDPVLEPVANAGPDQTVDNGLFVLLDGSASYDPQGLEPLAFTWQMVQRPSGSAASIVAPDTPMPGFQSDVPGDYVIEMTVANSAGVVDSTPDQVVVTVEQVLQPPVADAGIDLAGTVGTPVPLSGVASTDPQGLLPLSYSWSFASRPGGSTAQLIQPGSVTPSFTPDQAGTYVLELTVGNTAGLWDQTPDSVAVTVTELEVVEPIAEAGANFGVLPLEQVQLDGTASTDPSGAYPLVYAWTMVSKPSGSLAALDDPSASQPSFFADLAGSYTFELTVQNADGVWDTTPDTVTVESVPIDGFYVEVSWDNDNDLDLHILDGSTPMWGDGDCNYCNLNPEWGAPGPDDNPSLDADAIYGYGPETTTIDAPANGTYEVKVHYYGLDGASSCGSFSSCPVSIATVKVYLGGVLSQTMTRQMDDAGQVWTAVTIDWPSGQITPIDQMTTTSETYCY